MAAAVIEPSAPDRYRCRRFFFFVTVWCSNPYLPAFPRVTGRPLRPEMLGMHAWNQVGRTSGRDRQQYKYFPLSVVSLKMFLAAKTHVSSPPRRTRPLTNASIRVQPLGRLVRNLYPMMAYRGDKMRLIFRFVAELVLRHIRARSLPMRLWGWEQASRLIDLGLRHRWYFKAYLVRVAGFLRAAAFSPFFLAGRGGQNTARMTGLVCGVGKTWPTTEARLLVIQ